MIDMKNLRQGAGVCLLFLFLAGCTPYSLRLDDIDEETAQRPAVIQLSDPQVYARETLINDRDREARWLLKQLEESDAVSFEPQMSRELRSLSSAAVSLKSMAGTEGQEAGVKKDGAGAGGSDSGAGQKPDGKNIGSGNQNTGGGKQNVDVAVDSRTFVDSRTYFPVHEQESKPSGASPQESFHDRRAYRSELRSALAEAQLDDSHDNIDNALYRLQFHATVLPGAVKNKFGVARLTVLPPRLDETQLLELYKLWLSHITYRSNHVVSGKFIRDPNYSLLALGTDLYKMASFPTGAAGKDLSIAVPPSAPLRVLANILAERDNTATVALYEAVVAAKPAPAGAVTSPYAVTPGCAAANPDTIVYRDNNQSLTSGQMVDLVRGYLQLKPYAEYLAASLRGVELVKLEDGQKNAVFAAVAKFSDYYQAHESARLFLQTQNPQAAACFEPQAQLELPDRFRKILIDSADCTAEGCRANGMTYGYATTPQELAQRLSTSASTARSFELAASMMTQLQAPGSQGKGDFRALHASVGNVEAMERLPLVVGFSDREVSTAPEGEQLSQFGWVFGPKVIFDTENNNLKLSYVPANYDVKADLSIPGWWPHVGLKLETAWIGNWHATDTGNRDVIAADDSANTSIFRTRIPLNRADLDGLTERLAREAMGGSLPYTEIATVSPESLTVCAAGEVQLLVFGANLWQGSNAFLNGIPASKIEVLPDMSGLSIVFDIANMPVSGDKAELVVWTRNGTVSHELELNKDQNGIWCK